MGQRRLAARRIEHAHHIRAPTNSADGKSAADDFAQNGQIGRNLQEALRAGIAEPERDDFVEDQQYAFGSRRLGQRREIVLPRRNEPGAVG